MNITIQHRITYRYNAPVSYALQHLRLTPRNCASQEILRWSVTAGERDRLHEFVDAHGNIVMEAAQFREHEELVIVARGEVLTSDTGGVVSGLYDPLPSMFLCRPTELTEPDDAIRELAEAHRVALERDVTDGLQRLMHGLAAVFDVRADADETDATAADALSAGTGSAADAAQIFIALARHLDVPARFVSGYLQREPDAADQSVHAWAEAWLQGQGWIGFDVGRERNPDDAYVRLASGSDAQSASPVRGVQRGGSTEEIDIELKVSQSQGQRQN